MAKKKFLIYQDSGSWNEEWAAKELYQKGEELKAEITNFLEDHWPDWGVGVVREAVDGLGKLPYEEELRTMLADDPDGPGTVYLVKTDESQPLNLTKYVDSIISDISSDILQELQELADDEAEEEVATNSTDHISKEAKEYETYLRLKAKFEKVA